jgi:hypothetical protein
MYGVFHRVWSLIKRINRQRRLARLKPLPIDNEFLLVQLGPSFHETLLPSWKRASNELDRFQAEHGHLTLIIGVEVRQLVRLADFHVHPNNDAKEAA